MSMRNKKILMMNKIEKIKVEAHSDNYSKLHRCVEACGISKN